MKEGFQFPECNYRALREYYQQEEEKKLIELLDKLKVLSIARSSDVVTMIADDDELSRPCTKKLWLYPEEVT